MSEKRIIWTVLFGTAALVGWRTLRVGNDPIPQLAGIGAAGFMLLILSEFAPKLGSGLAVLLATALALNWETLPATATKPIGTGGPFTGTKETPTGSGGGGGGAW